MALPIQQLRYQTDTLLLLITESLQLQLQLQLMNDASTRYRIEPGQLTLHQDRGQTI